MACNIGPACPLWVISGLSTSYQANGCFRVYTGRSSILENDKTLTIFDNTQFDIVPILKTHAAINPLDCCINGQPGTADHL